MQGGALFVYTMRIPLYKYTSMKSFLYILTVICTLSPALAFASGSQPGSFFYTFDSAASHPKTGFFAIPFTLSAFGSPSDLSARVEALPQSADSTAGLVYTIENSAGEAARGISNVVLYAPNEPISSSYHLKKNETKQFFLIGLFTPSAQKEDEYTAKVHGIRFTNDHSTSAMFETNGTAKLHTPTIKL